MTHHQRRKILALSYASIFALGLLYYISIKLTGVSIPCSFYEITGKMCGTCGTTRMMLSLAEFNISKAFSYNPVMFILFVLWHIVLIFVFIGKPKFMHNYHFVIVLTVLSFIAISVYTIFRIFC